MLSFRRGFRWIRGFAPRLCFASAVGRLAAEPPSGRTPARTATEQLLISTAVDRAIEQIDFTPLAGKNVYFDPQYLEGIVDKNYVISTMRQHMLAQHCILNPDKQTAEFTIEARAGAVGTNHHDVLLGVPALSLPTGALIGMPSAIPEIPFAKSTDQKGVAKIACFAYNNTNGQAVWQSGVYPVVCNAKDSWFLGTGPFQRGSIYDGTRFAGSRLMFSRRKRTPDPPKLLLSLSDAKYFDDLPFVAEPLPKKAAQERSGREYGKAGDVQSDPHCGSDRHLARSRHTQPCRARPGTPSGEWHIERTSIGQRDQFAVHWPTGSRGRLQVSGTLGILTNFATMAPAWGHKVLVATMYVYLLATLDTKGDEAAYIRGVLAAAGADVRIVDTGCLGTPTIAADVTREELFAAGGTSLADLRAKNDRGLAVTAAAAGATKLIDRLHAAGKVSGVLAIGGSAGTAIGTAAMRALPLGVPKLMVSTLASGQVRHYVGDKDILMLNSVVDILGVNRISRLVLGTAARAMAGMVTFAARSRPRVTNR